VTGRTGAWLLAAALAATSCRRCSGESPPDAALGDDGGARAAPAPAPLPGLPAADLRQAVMLALPEFRGVTGLYAVAVVERRYAGALPPGTRTADALGPGLAAQGWKPAQAEGKPLVGESPPFFLEGLEEEGHPVVRAGIVVPGEKVVDVLQSPAPLGSQSLAQRIPPLPGAGGYGERFVFEVHYRARPEVSAKLLAQLGAGLVGAGWRAPAGGALGGAADAGLPEPLQETLAGPHAGRMTLARSGERVTVTWEQPLTTGRR
jgi:hypothetical protein